MTSEFTSAMPTTVAAMPTIPHVKPSATVAAMPTTAHHGRGDEVVGSIAACDGITGYFASKRVLTVPSPNSSGQAVQATMNC